VGETDTPPQERGELIGAALLVAVAVAFRLYALGRLPGINGDEAWYGVRVLQLLAGEPVEWRTPNGNLPGPLHTALLVPLQAVLPRSFVVLRLPALLSSLAQLALTWFVVRRHFGRQAALVALVLTAVLPVNVAYARFGWDPSHSGLVAVAALHFALSGGAWASAGLLAFALAVHPTNVFLGPFLFTAFLFAEVRRRGGWRAAAPRSALHGVLLLATLGVLRVVTGGGAGHGFGAGALGRLASPSEMGTFVRLFVRFLSGDTTFQYVAGAGYGSARTAVELVVGTLLATVLVLGGVRLARSPVAAEHGVVAGWLATIPAFYALAGNMALQASIERYALVLVVPTLVAVTVLLGAVGERMGRRWLVPAGVGVMGVLALVGFADRYLAAIEATGSTSETGFWTGPVEPKAEAFRLIAIEAGARGGARVVTEDYWTFQPLAYLAHGTKVEVVEAQSAPRAPLPGGTYWVGFAGGPLERWARGQPSLLPRWDVGGAGRRVALRVWWTPPGVDPRRR
jgi:hypothetical protein